MKRPHSAVCEWCMSDFFILFLNFTSVLQLKVSYKFSSSSHLLSPNFFTVFVSLSRLFICFQNKKSQPGVDTWSWTAQKRGYTYIINIFVKKKKHIERLADTMNDDGCFSLRVVWWASLFITVWAVLFMLQIIKICQIETTLSFHNGAQLVF